MKRFAIVLLMVTASAQAQQTSATLSAPSAASGAGAPSTSPSMNAPTNTSTGSFGSGFMQQVRERLRISYFGELYGPNAKKWDDNQYDGAGTKMTDPVQMWHNFNVSTKLFGKTSFVMSPRFYTIFGDRNDIVRNNDSNERRRRQARQDENVVVMDDWQFGFQQNIIKEEKVTWDSRLTHRAPFSTVSQTANIDSQIEWMQGVTWKPIPQIFVLSQSTLRYYMYEEQVTEERYRMNQLTAFNWIFNDKWKVQLFNEFDMQHRNPKDKNANGHKQWNYFLKNKNIIATGLGYNFSPNLTIMPYIKALNDEDIRPETLQIGFWAFGKVF